MTLARVAPACSLCRRFAPYDWSEAQWRNLNNIKWIRPLDFARGDKID